MVSFDAAVQTALQKLEDDPSLADRTTLTPAQIADLLNFVLRSIYIGCVRSKRIMLVRDCICHTFPPSQSFVLPPFFGCCCTLVYLFWPLRLLGTAFLNSILPYSAMTEIITNAILETKERSSSGTMSRADFTEQDLLR